ncbi:prepilin-type N-terminal cleavage/methylation domain-containing protein [Candidatus Uhrbacteria bacterium]|nr:prepilin-type N-terminal cleavage/methylation domain-containing protein [Candidatus Uhrbacteria bacterium]
MTNQGFSLVEVIVAIALLGIVALGFVRWLVVAQENVVFSGQRTRALFLAEEGLEAVRNMRDDDFSLLTNGTHGLAVSGWQWIFSGSSDTTDLFTREVTVFPVDADRKEVMSQITWNQTPYRLASLELVTYLTNWQAGNAQPIPITPDATLNLAGPANGTEVALYTDGGTTYILLGRVSSSEKEFYVINVSDPSNPVVTAELEIGSDVNGVAVVGSYAFLATSSNTAELQVVNLTNPASPTFAGSSNLAGNADAITVVGQGSNLYVGRASNSSGPEIFSLSIATPSSPSVLSSLEVGDSVWKMVLDQSASFVYAATGSTTAELLIVNTTTPSSIVQEGALNISGTTDATAIAVFSTYTALGMDDGNFYVVDTSTPASPFLASSALDIGIKINDMAMGVDDDYLFAGSGTVNTEVAVINVSDPSSPTIYFSVDLAGNEAKGLIWDQTLNRVFGGGTGNTEEFFVLIP